MANVYIAKFALSRPTQHSCCTISHETAWLMIRRIQGTSWWLSCNIQTLPLWYTLWQCGKLRPIKCLYLHPRSKALPTRCARTGVQSRWQVRNARQSKLASNVTDFSSSVVEPDVDFFFSNHEPNGETFGITAGLWEELGPIRPSGHTPRGCGRQRKDFKGFIQNKQTNPGAFHEWSGEGLQHLLGATKHTFSAIQFRPTGSFKFSKIFWNSDYRQNIPFKSTDISRYRIQPFCILSFHLQF